MTASPSQQQIDAAIGRGDHRVDFGATDPRDGNDAMTARTITADSVRRWITSVAQTSRTLSIRGARLTSTLDLSHTKISVPLSFEACWFDGGIDIEGAALTKLELHDCRIGTSDGVTALAGDYLKLAAELDASRSVFEGTVTLVHATIKGGVQLGPTREGSSDTWPTRIGYAWTDGGWTPRTDLRHGFDATNATITDVSAKALRCAAQTTLAGANVAGQINLRGAELRAGGGERPYSLFAQRVSVGESVLANPLDDDSVNFIGPCSFRGASIGGQLDLRRAHLDAPRPSLDLMAATIEGTLRLTDLDLAPDTDVDLTRTTIGHLQRASPLWGQGTYRVDGMTYTSIDDLGQAARTWLAEAADGSSPAPYVSLADAAKAQGRPDEERSARIEAARRAARPIERTAFGWIGFGYRPFRLVWPMLALFVLVSLLASAANDAGENFRSVGDPPVTVDACDEAHTDCLEPALYGLDAIIPIDLDQTSTWKPVPTASGTANALRWSVIVTSIVRWVVAGLVLGAVTGKLSRA